MKKHQSGQTLLIVVLVMVVVLTVGLSVAIRTTSNIRTTTEDDNSQRAFSAAEAGIEKTLINNTSISTTNLGNNSSYSTQVSILSGNSLLVDNGILILKDEPVDVWLANYPDYSSPWSGNITINWGNTGGVCDMPEGTANLQSAMEAVIVSGTKNSPKVNTYAFDPCSSRSTANKFQFVSTPGDVVNGKTFAYKAIIPTVSSGLLMRLIPLYAPAAIGIEGSVSLPAQGTIISSTGVSDTTQRKIVSFRGYPKLPIELFPFIFFSPK